MSESARAEVDAYPDAILFIHQQVHEMIAAADGAKLLASHIAEVLELPRSLSDAVSDVPGRIVIQQVVVDLFGVLAAYAETDGLPQIVHDGGDVAADIGCISIGAHRLVAAADVITRRRWAR